MLRLRDWIAVENMKATVRGDPRPFCEDDPMSTPADTPRAPRAPLTSDELREIRERADGATPGPWQVVEDCVNCSRAHVAETRRETERGDYGEVLAWWYPEIDRCDNGIRPNDAAFIASARSDVPALCAEVERLTRERDEARNELADAAREINCSGPVWHRIRVLKEHHAERVKGLELDAERWRHFRRLLSVEDDIECGGQYLNIDDDSGSAIFAEGWGNTVESLVDAAIRTEARLTSTGSPTDDER